MRAGGPGSLAFHPADWCQAERDRGPQTSTISSEGTRNFLPETNGSPGHRQARTDTLPVPTPTTSNVIVTANV